MSADLFAIIAPVFLCAALGYGWARLGQTFQVDFVTNLVTTIGTPCLILSTLLKLEVTSAAFGAQALAAALVFALVALAGCAILLVLRLPFHSYLPALMFPNAGNMGLPLALFAFGERGLALGIGYFTVAATMQFTVGAGIAAGRASFGQLLRTPLIYTVVLGVICMIFEVQAPRWITNTVNLVGGLTIPLMLMALGVSLARLRVSSLPRAIAFSALRLCLGFAVSLLVATLLDLDPVQKGVLILQSAMPVAVFNYLFASRYQRQPEEVASMVLISTALAFLALPLLLLFILPAGG
ncbi:MAG: AEC family transporter [Alphaproteobacteria bacterium]|nr:AEC family transporter [Alphaproteobacteria bacterium]